MKYSQQRQLVDDLRTLADFYERPESLALPYPYGLTTQTHYINEYSYNEKREYVKDEAKTLAALRRYARRLGAHTKNYSGNDFELVKEFGHKIRLRFVVSREAVCTKRLVGVKTHEAKIVPAYTEEIYEWDCEPVSLLAD